MCGDTNCPYDTEWLDNTYAKACTPLQPGYFTVPVLKCATPVLRYEGGTVQCSCETEDVYYVYSVVPTSMSGMSTDGVINLDIEYKVNVRAVREGYQTSEVASLTLNMSNVGDYNGDGRMDITDVTRLINLILNSK